MIKYNLQLEFGKIKKQVNYSNELNAWTSSNLDGHIAVEVTHPYRGNVKFSTI